MRQKLSEILQKKENFLICKACLDRFRATKNDLTDSHLQKFAIQLVINISMLSCWVAFNQI